MLSIREALDRCLAAVPALTVETVSIEAAYERVLAEDVIATTALPAWDNSAMDGFAIRAADSGGVPTDEADDSDCCAEAGDGHAGGPWLQVVETIAAGSVATQVVEPGTAARIMTGAPMPRGADAVVMREYTTVDAGPPERVQVHSPATLGQHIRRAGEDVQAGSVVLRPGTILGPACVGLCASVGRSEVVVARRPTVGIVSTGDEVVPPGQPLGPGQIHSSNTHALTGWIRRAGGVPVDCGIAPDTLDGTRAAFRRAIGCDIIVSTGGVSVGDFDVVRQAMMDEGADMQFWKVRIKPGKPLAFGIIGERPAFGLPGNPVSCQVGFLQFVHPFIRRCVGDPHPFLPTMTATLKGDVRKKAGRAELVRVRLSWTAQGLVASPTRSQGSGMQTAMTQAHGLLLLDVDSTGAIDGESVTVQIIDDRFLASDEPGYPW